MPDRWSRSIFLVLLALGACTSPPDVAPSTEGPTVPGTVISMTTGQVATSIVRLSLVDGTATTVTSPVEPLAVNRGSVSGAASDGSTVFLSAGAREVRAYRLAPDATDPQAVGPPLPLRQEPLLAIASATAVVASCEHGVWALPLTGNDRWSRVGDGCWAALGPDGDEVALSPGGRSIVVSSISAPASTPLLDLSDLRPSLGGIPGTPRLIGGGAWSPEGLAFMVQVEDQFAVFLRRPDGSTVRVLQERYVNTSRVPVLAWQPGGQLLAIADDVGAEGAVLRVYDARADELRVVTLDPVGFAGLDWAPGGDSIAVLTGTRALLVVALDGEWLLRRQTDWRQLLAWTGSG